MSNRKPNRERPGGSIHLTPRLRFRQVLAQGTIVEQKALLRGFIAGITITLSKDRGVITWYDLPASFSISGGRRQKLYRASFPGPTIRDGSTATAPAPGIDRIFRTLRFSSRLTITPNGTSGVIRCTRGAT